MEKSVLEAALSRRTIVKLSLMAPAVAAIPVGLRGAAAQDKVVVTMVTDTAGLGDQNFNDLANKGGTQAAADLGIDWKVIESVDQAAYVPNLTAGAEQGPLTVAVGFLLTDAVSEVAAQFPDKHFQLIDSVAEGDNVRNILFHEEQIGFLAGVVAGKSTKSNKIGIVGGQRIPPVIRYEVGFVSGVKSVNPAAEIIINYTDTFGDQALGKQTAAAQLNAGADILFPIAGLTGTGCYLAVAEANKPGQIWVVGVDTAQDHLAPGYELCVAQKGVDFAVYEGCRLESEGKFETGTVNYDLASGGVSLSTYPDRVAPEVDGLARAYEEMIKSGELVVPVDDDTLKAFTPPAEPAPLPATPVADGTATA